MEENSTSWTEVSPDYDSSLDQDLEDQDRFDVGKRTGSPDVPERRASLSSGALTESPDEDEEELEQSPEPEPGSPVLDEFLAFEQDILLVDVTQEDPDLFGNLPERSLLRLGPLRASAPPRGAAPPKMSPAELNRRLAAVAAESHPDNLDAEEEGDSRPWRPRRGAGRSTPAPSQPRPGQSDYSSSHLDGRPERPRPPPGAAPPLAPPPGPKGLGQWIKTSATVTDTRRQKSYCRQYFSESPSCSFQMCRFQHLPVEGDEKFCVETVARFLKNPECLHKAGAVFTGYYRTNPPGAHFSGPGLRALLWALLKAGRLPEVLSVLNVCSTHQILPGHEFLLDLFKAVREKSLSGFGSELMQLTFKMAGGLELSLDCLDCIRGPNSAANNKLPSSPPSPENLSLAHAVIEMELCAQQESWTRLGEVFRCVFRFGPHPQQAERVSGRVAVALLNDAKDKLVLPFTAFAETVCQGEGEDNLVKSFVGRIGVSLMLRYYKTQQVAKGRRVVEALSRCRVAYAALKGLFGNEDGASRCCLVTVATELLLLTGSVEGALNTLRENEWFLSSSAWPCERTDLESRTRVLIRLAEKTSHRDTLEVLRNLPGIKEPNDWIDVSMYQPLFDSHLRACVDKQILPLASDTLDVMRSQNLAVDHKVLQLLLHKLGKQHLWQRARDVFRHSLRSGCYPDVCAPPGSMALSVPCGLGEVELALVFELFITVNAAAILPLPEASASSLSITLKRSQSSESEYLSAGSLLLSAASIPQPKLLVHYTAVNLSQEQVFRLDASSARRWLRHNLQWAAEVWAQ